MIEILFVDDDADLLVLMKTKFEKSFAEAWADISVTVSVAASAHQCLDFLEKKSEAKSVLVISDINMPEMDGLALLRIIQKRHPRVKVYICTGFDTPFFRKNSEDKGAMRFFVKPLNYEVLLSAVREDFALS